MKIAIILRDITERGGGERVAANLANALCDLPGFEVKLISFFRSFESISFKLSDKVDLNFLCHFSEKCKNPFLRVFYKHIWRIFLNFKARKFYHDCDVILANDRALMQGFRMPNKRYIRLWHLKFKKKNLRFFDDLVVLSNREITKWQKIHPRVHIIENFLPKQNKSVLSDYNQKVVLAIGRFSEQKDFLGLIEMYAKIAKKFPEWKLKIIGEGAQKIEMEQRIKALNMGDYIEIKPFMQDISKAYLGASIYVLSSVFEGFGMVLAEASSYGLACVSFDIDTGPSDIIIDHKSGFLVKNRNFDELARYLEILMINVDLRKDMGRAAARYVCEKFSQDNIIRKWQELLLLKAS